MTAIIITIIDIFEYHFIMYEIAEKLGGYNLIINVKTVKYKTV